MLIIWLWCNNLSNIALVITGSPNVSDHLDNGLFVVTIVEFFSYLLATNWNNKLADSLSNGKNPTSSIISNLYLLKNFNLLSFNHLIVI